MNVFEAYRAGGPFMHPITLMGVLTVTITIWKLVSIYVKRTVNYKLLDLIRMSGSLALAIGFLAQILGIIMALGAIKQAGDISPDLLYAGVIISFYTPIWGFIVLLVSLVFYAVLKEIVRHKL